jgi:hypothetical protein
MQLPVLERHNEGCYQATLRPSVRDCPVSIKQGPAIIAPNWQARRNARLARYLRSVVCRLAGVGWVSVRRS